MASASHLLIDIQTMASCVSAGMSRGYSGNLRQRRIEVAAICAKFLLAQEKEQGRSCNKLLRQPGDPKSPDHVTISPKVSPSLFYHSNVTSGLLAS